MPTENSRSCGAALSREQVLNEVIEIVADFSNVAPDQIREEQTLFNDLAWDSLDMVEATMEIEEHFDLSVPDELVGNVKTVRDIVDGVWLLIGNAVSHD
jgi:acyl carrier protein